MLNKLSKIKLNIHKYLSISREFRLIIDLDIKNAPSHYKFY